MAFETNNHEIYLSVTDHDIVGIEKYEQEIVAILESFITPRTLEESFNYVNEKIYIDESLFIECVDSLKENNLLKESKGAESLLSEYHQSKYKRQISSFTSMAGVEKQQAEKMQMKICSSTVCVIGIGGIGSYLSLALAMIGVENLILVDFDRVELSNTSRQVLYTEKDIGKLKTSVAGEKLKEYNKNLKIITYNTQIQSDLDLSFVKNYDLDLLILCADTPRGRIQYIIDDVARRYTIPWFFFGPYNHSKVSVGPLIIPGKTKFYRDIYPESISAHTSKVAKINNNFVASICDPYNGFAAQFAAIEAFKFLSGVKVPAIINKRYYIDTDQWSLEYEEYG